MTACAHNRIDMAGQRFGRLLVRSFVETRGKSTKKAYWLCTCDCGNECVTSGANLRSGSTKSCGCLYDTATGKSRSWHGMSRSKTYATWASIQARCYNPNQSCYSKYGALGVTVCARWRRSFEDFLADMGERPPGKTLDRINPFGNYEPQNCKWATHEEQSLNKRGRVAVAILVALKKAGHGDLIDHAFKGMFGDALSWSPARAFEDGYTLEEAA